MMGRKERGQLNSTHMDIWIDAIQWMQKIKCDWLRTATLGEK